VVFERLVNLLGEIDHKFKMGSSGADKIIRPDSVGCNDLDDPGKILIHLSPHDGLEEFQTPGPELDFIVVPIELRDIVYILRCLV